MKLTEYTIPFPGLEFLFRAEVKLSDTYPLGNAGGGYREIVTVCGGSFEGKIKGEIVSFGGDWGLLHSGNINELDTKYLLKTDDDALVSVECHGKLIMSMEEMNGACESGTFSDCYFRQTISFTTGAEQYYWLNEIVAVGASVISPSGDVVLDVYMVT